MSVMVKSCVCKQSALFGSHYPLDVRLLVRLPLCVSLYVCVCDMFVTFSTVQQGGDTK